MLNQPKTLKEAQSSARKELGGKSEVFNIWEIEPIDFRTFVESESYVGHSPLSPRQYEAVFSVIGLNPKEIFSPKRKKDIGIILWGKGSLLGHTEIITANGIRNTLEELNLANKPIRVFSKTVDGKVIDVLSTPPIKKSKKENCFEVTTSFGHISECSEDHKFFTVNGWKKLKELKVHDWICAPTKIEITSFYDVDVRVAKWIGYMIGDGCISGDHKPVFFASKPDIIKDYVSIIESFGGKVKVRKHNTPKSKYITFVFKDGTRDTNLLLHHAKNLGIYGKTSKDKRIPVEIMFSSEDVRIAFLESLYATDGWISTHGKNAGWEIGYISKNRKLIDDLDFMLRGFGIVGKIKPKYVLYKGERRIYWQLLIIHKGMQSKFTSIFDVPGKTLRQRQLKKFLTEHTFKMGFDCPPELTKLATPEISVGIGKKFSQLRGRLKNQNLNYTTLCGLGSVKELANDDIMWEKIVSVQPLGDQDVYTLTVNETHNYYCGGLFHHNSGKDLVSALVIAYSDYVLLCMKDPARTLFVGKSISHLDIINVAKKGQQADELFFSYFSNAIKACRWFREHYTILENNRIRSKPGKGMNKGTIKIGINKIEFPKRIRAHSVTSDNESFEGYNVVMYVLDEISGFRSKAEQENGWKIYKTLRSSLKSRSTKNFKGFGFVLSYPRQMESDIILDLYNLALRRPNMYGSFGYPWQIKPEWLFNGATFMFNHPRIDEYLGMAGVGIKIPIEYKDEFEEDPANCVMVYLCMPPRLQGAWVEYPELFYATINPDKKDIFDIVRKIVPRAGPDGKLVNYVEIDIVKCNVPPMDLRRREYVLWSDQGETECDAVVGIAHLDNRKKDDGKPTTAVIMDSVLIWRPDPTKNIRVSISNFEDVITEQIPKFLTIRHAWGDKWNSAALEEKLMKKGISCGRHNLDRGDYDVLKRSVYLGEFEALPEDDYNQGITQLVNLVYGTGNVPNKRTGHLKDTADVYVGCCRLLKGGEMRGSVGDVPQVGRLPQMVTSGDGIVPPLRPFQTGVYDQKYLDIERKGGRQRGSNSKTVVEEEGLLSRLPSPIAGWQSGD